MGRSNGDSEPRSSGRRPSKTPRRKGSGGIVLVRSGVWRVDIELSRDPVTGRRRRISRQIEGTHRDAEVALARLTVAREERRLPVGGTSASSVRAALDAYLDAAKSGQIELAPRTIVTTKSAINTMCATRLLDGREFGRVTLNRLSWQAIEEMYAGMRSAGAGADWTRRCATVLSRGLDFARKRGLIDANPAKDAVRPKSTRRKPFAPTVEEVRNLLRSVRQQDEEFADAVSVLAGTGMRKAELLGLRWGDVDLEAGEIHVAWAITDAGPGRGIERKATKKSDWRDVPMTAQVVDAVERQFERAASRWGPKVDESWYVFSHPLDGSVAFRPDSFTDRWSKLRGASSITVQDLRHFAATVMLDAGESYRTVADLLGNSENTLRLHYDGRTDVGKRRAISALEL